MTQPAVGPNVIIPKNPADRLSGYTVAWAAWVAAFAIIETIAIVNDAKHRDRVKRTLSSNLRTIFATDSSGVPLDVPCGKLRRFVLITGTNWFEKHIERTKFV